MRLPYFKNVVWWTMIIIIALVVAGCWRVKIITDRQIAQIERDRARVEFVRGLRYCQWMRISEGGYIYLNDRNVEQWVKVVKKDAEIK